MANDIKILDHLNIDLDGDGIAERYEIGGISELPIASSEVLGGVKVGENLTITEDGTLNAEASGTSVLSPGAVLYDTKEKVIGKWINGKPLYQKVINLFETIVLQSYVWTNVFMIENMEKIIDIECIIGTVLNDGRLRWNCLNNYICGAAEEDNFTIDSCTIIIQYTKTTDEENSFTPDMIIDHENITDAEIADAAAADKI